MQCKRLIVFSSKRRTLSLAVELGERAVEAQACYSLGNTYTLLRDFVTAIDYHQRHLAIAQELGDKVGEVRILLHLQDADIDKIKNLFHFIVGSGMLESW